MSIEIRSVTRGTSKKNFQRPKKTIETPKTPFSLSIAAIPAESIPFIGVAVLIADTRYELYAACETASELDQLYLDLGMADETPDDVMHSVCDPELPEAGRFGMGLLKSLESGWIRLRVRCSPAQIEAIVEPDSIAIMSGGNRWRL